MKDIIHYALENVLRAVRSARLHRLPQELFSKIHFIPDPVPGDGHYKAFEAVYGMMTDDRHRQSLKKVPRREKRLPFVASVQHAKNTNLILQCEECEMWRHVYSRFKFSNEDRTTLDRILEDCTFTCGASLSDLELPDPLNSV